MSRLFHTIYIPKYESVWDTNGRKPMHRQVFKGYTVTHSTAVTIRDLDAAGEILSWVSDASPSNISALQFMVDPAKYKEMKDRALVLSFKDAQARALRVGRETGLKLGKVASINLGGTSYGKYGFAAESRKVYSSSALSIEPELDVSIAPGESRIAANSSISYFISEQ